MHPSKSLAESRLSTASIHADSCFESLEARTLLSASVAHTKKLFPVASRSAATAGVAQTAPVLAAVPDATVNYGSRFTYQLVATGTPAPTFSLNDAPDGVVVDSASGLVSWTPTLGDVGTDTISVRAANTAGSSSKSFKITVTNYVAPVISTPPSQNAVEGTTFTYQVAATGTPAPAFSLLAAPAGMTISPTGLISWAAPNAIVSAQNVTVQATNPGGSTSTTFAISVGPDVTPPTAPVLSLGTITSVDSIPLSWTPSTDNIGVAGYRIYNYTPAVYRGHSGRDGGYYLVSPAKLTLLVDNVTSTSFTFTGLAANSTHRYVVTAFDAAGNQSGSSGVVIGTTLNPPSFHWTYYGATDPVMTDVADHALNFYFNTTGSPAPDLALVSAPAGVIFTPGQFTNSQLTTVIPNISWTPTPDEVGINYITMQATNSVGSYTMSIEVKVSPDTPQISVSLNGGITYGASQFAAGQSNYVVTAIPAFGNTTSPQYGLAGTPLNFQVSCAGNAGPTTFALVSGPPGLTLDPNTGTGKWTPFKETAGNTTVIVAATNSAGTSTLTLSFPTYFTGAPGAPLATYDLAESGIPTNDATLSWAAPADTVGITGYIISVTDAHTGASWAYDTLSTDTTYTLTGLGSQQYFVTVTPYDSNNNRGQESLATSIYGRALSTLLWTTPTDATRGTPLAVQFTSMSGFKYSIVSGPPGAQIDADTGLFTWTPDVQGEVSFVIAAQSQNGWGNLQALLSFSVV